ncbi:MAG: ATP-dependent DNA helicase [Deltaproteobacteria bacterium]|jgi:ATP-dependent DNA helicase DinG|nr:ATP-dependent DNA helicase [Deltaproteobacteria bacterium]
MRVSIPNAFPSDLRDLEYILKKDGALSKAWPDFEPREAQQKMFLEVSRAFKHSDISIIEAGTGTGKTLAYLLPALISGKKTFISTGLKNLQEQIFHKDLEFIRQYIDRDFKAAIVKGRENYLCLRRLKAIAVSLDERGDLFPDDDYAQARRFALKTLQSWAARSVVGELAEVAGRYEKTPPFDQLTSSGRQCLGQSCSERENCFIARVRQRAQEADLVLVNHHLFMADLRIREQLAGYGFLPDWEAIVFDEAHLLENTATQYFSRDFSTQKAFATVEAISGLIEDLKTANQDKISDKGIQTLKSVEDLIEAISGEVIKIHNNHQNQRETSFLWPLEESQWTADHRELRESLLALQFNLEKCAIATHNLEKAGEDFKTHAETLDELAENLHFIASNEDPGYVYQVRATGEETTLAAVPINVSNFLKAKLFKLDKTIILTSATLGLMGEMDYFRRQLGIETAFQALSLASPFDFAKNSLLYLPNMPHPTRKREEFQRLLPGKILEILRATQGRALVLFTSYAEMNSVHNILIRAKLPYPLLIQGAGPRGKLLEDFRDRIDSVLLATKSFFQGVDVPGESLSAVIIDRIPFPQRGNPMVIAKKRLIDSQGGRSFTEYDLPEAIFLLKQAVGRLIRSKSDRGVVALMDSRLTSESYGFKILRNLPLPSQAFTREIGAVEEFFGSW